MPRPVFMGREIAENIMACRMRQAMMKAGSSVYERFLMIP